MEIPNTLYPVFSEDGQPHGVREPFSLLCTLKRDRLALLRERLNGLSLLETGGLVEWPKEELLEDQPWFRNWVDANDQWVESNGHRLRTPTSSPFDLFTEVFLNRSSRPHIDDPSFLPTALSIGIQGARELLSVVFPSLEEAEDAVRFIKTDNLDLGTLETLRDRPVHRIKQRKGDVVCIAGYATVHTGRPISRRRRSKDNISVAITRKATFARGALL